MVLNAAVQMLREADDLKQKILKFKNGTSMLQERTLWTYQQQLQKIYQKVLVLDLDYSLEKKVEQDLWNVGFKQQIEALQAISKDRKNPLRSDGQAMLSWVLQAAAGFYLCLLHQICTAFKLDLPFRRRASLLGWVEGWGAGEAGAEVEGRLPAPAAARYICQHCLVHLGDLARYRQQLRVAHTFYRHALVVSVHSGQPYNQLALVAWRRGRRLAALYWHVRSLLVRAPFPPAPANLARTLHAAASGGLSQEGTLPVLPGMGVKTAVKAPGSTPAARLDAHTYVNELIRAMHMIHSVEQLDTAEAIVKTLSASLPALVASDSFESMTLVKMTCVLIWLVHSATEDFKLDNSALSESESAAAQLSESLAAATALALVLPAVTQGTPPRRALPALKVWLRWAEPRSRAFRGPAAAAFWAALGHALTALADRAAAPHLPDHAVETAPLPEDEELHGFLPIEHALSSLKFPHHAAWDSYGGRLPEPPGEHQTPGEAWACLAEPELQHRVRAARLVRLGRRLARARPDQLTHTEEDDVSTFTSPIGEEQLAVAAAQLSSAPAPPSRPHQDSDDEPPPPPPPVIISEADFREKVREKRVGILKPQGSLERAREERAMASTQDDPEVACQEVEVCEDSSKSDDKKEIRKPRVNIAMAAIMRKQEETNKQVKFVTPPPTPDSTTDATDKDQDKPKVIQPKAIKGLVSLPLGRKTGGILSLKDKSAGYPHLVNAEPEPPKKTEKEEKKDPKPNQQSPNSQNYQPKRQDQPPSPNWNPNPQANAYDGPRMNFQKNYGIQNAGITYNPSYSSPTNTGGQGIRLPVVNPKEIDVRTAALQKQTSRAELFQEGHKFGAHNYQMSGDKKNFLNDLPPRFANQYRYWQAAQDSQLTENKFRDDNFKNNSLFNQPTWMAPQQPQDAYQQPPWWKPENPPNFNSNFSQSVNMQPNFYSPHLTSNVPNPYQNMQSFNQLQNSSQQNQPGYVHSAIGQPQLQTLQNIVSSPNFSSSLNNFSYAPPVGYDSSMYPQFNSKLGYQPPVQMKMLDKPSYPTHNQPGDNQGLGFGSTLMDQQRNLHMNFNDSLGRDIAAMKTLDSTSADGAGSTYSLFSGAPEPPAWAAASQHPHQSLWSGPGPSPLERLLEQQKQMKQPPAPQ